MRPRSMAKTLGYEVSAPNGWSEFGAIYVGVFIAQALLCGLAISRVSDAVLGDLCAIFLLLTCRPIVATFSLRSAYGSITTAHGA